MVFANSVVSGANSCIILTARHHFFVSRAIGNHAPDFESKGGAASMRAQNEYCWRELRLRGFAVPRSFLWRCAAMCAVVTGVGMRAGAQPLPDEQPKFSQLP